jgi:CRISPR-associated protein Cas2
MIFTTNNEQGYSAISNGDTSRDIINHEGMILTSFQHKRKDQYRAIPEIG